MALNASGPISLGGTTSGQSIELELGGSGTSQISLNCSTVRTLAGVASGAIIMPTNFYGKSSVLTTGVYYGGRPLPWGGQSNIITRINACGALIGSQTALCAITQNAAAKAGAYALNYGGCSLAALTRATRINKCGSSVGSTTVVNPCGDGARRAAGAPVLGNAMFFGGITNGWYVYRINGCGALAAGVTAICNLLVCHGGANAGSYGVFYGGGTNPGIAGNTVIRINGCGARVGSTTNVGTGRVAPSGAKIGSNAVFYGGTSSCGTVFYNTVTRINSCGALVGSQTTAGTARFGTGGASVGSYGVFYGGATLNACYCLVLSNTVTRVNSCGALVGSQTTVGSTRACLPGAGI